MRFPAVYQKRVELELRFLLANLEPVEGPEIEVVFREVEKCQHPFDLMEGLGDETPNLSGAEVAPIEE